MNEFCQVAVYVSTSFAENVHEDRIAFKVEIDEQLKKFGGSRLQIWRVVEDCISWSCVANGYTTVTEENKDQTIS